MSDDGFGASAVRLCGAANHILAWRPSEFWEATPAELATALNGPGEGGSLPADRATFDALRALFPD